MITEQEKCQMICTQAFEAMTTLSTLKHEIDTMLNTPTAINAPHHALQDAADSIHKAIYKMAEAYAESIYIETDPANVEISI